MNTTKLIGACLLACGVMAAEAPQNQNENAARMAAGSQPIYRVTVISRTAKAVNYQHRGGATKIDFKGTDLLAGSRGEAKVESKQGYIEIEVEFDNLQPANKLGSEYLTYVLWAITPEGRTSNLGEILLNGNKAKLDVTTQLQVFGLVVTAEPYYAVSRPSDLIVMENVVRPDTRGKIEEIEAKYELLQRGQYERLSNPLAMKLDASLPIELYEARNAVQIARSVGADRFANETFQKAEQSLVKAEAAQTRRSDKKAVVMTAREAVQMAEDSRAIAVKRQEADALALERQQSVDREVRADTARVSAQSETERVTRDAEAARLRAQADTDRLTRDAEAARLKAMSDTDRLTRDAEAARLKALAENERLKRDSDARTASAAMDANRLKLDNDARLAAMSDEAKRLKSEADRLKGENDAERAASQAALDDAAKQKARLETEKAELRVLLLKQFNAVLQTRDTARGLIINMSDVLFDTGKFSLRPTAREKLAKVAGIVAGHPGLKLDVEGHTDSVGADDYNQTLSENRGTAVRDYLTGEGMAPSSVTTKGFGKTQPVASNDTAEGRQQNRRVELVISGEIIGSVIGIPIAQR